MIRITPFSIRHACITHISNSITKISTFITGTPLTAPRPLQVMSINKTDQDLLALMFFCVLILVPNCDRCSDLYTNNLYNLCVSVCGKIKAAVKFQNMTEVWP